VRVPVGILRRMLTILRAHVYNLADAVREMRASWESWEKSDSDLTDSMNMFQWRPNTGWTNPCGAPGLLGASDRRLCSQLLKAGTDHAKFTRQIMVGLTIEAPGFWWKQMDQYRVGADVTTNSTSQMHTLGRRPLTPSDFDFDELNDPLVQEYVQLAERARLAWIDSGKKRGGKAWRRLQAIIAYSWTYRRGVTLNYQVLRSVYHARSHHRLDEWHRLCAWIESLPYAELLILPASDTPSEIPLKEAA
jgi:hypothetical protein